MPTVGIPHTHRFDPVSGWCESCNFRQDGRLIGKGGDVWREGRAYTPREIAEMIGKNR